jgi:UDPglucose 6-dehydrogenase
MMRVSVIGTGYVGLVTGACLADKGHTVICVDVDTEKVNRINRGDPPIHEKDLEPMLRRNIGSRLAATNDLEAAVLDSDLSFIAVGTPFDGAAIDLGYIREASRQVGEALAKKSSYHVVVVKSTVVPGTTEEVVVPELEAGSGRTAGRDFGVGMNPEFLREGEAIADFMNPDRIVMGGIDERSIDGLEELYAVFEGVETLRTSTRTAEMIKYTSNSLLATLISFSNEVGNLCSRLGGIDVVDVMRGVHLDKRFSPILPDGQRITPGFTTYLAAGCGFGGSCFPKDVKALIAHGHRSGAPMRILDAVMSVNESQPDEIFRLLDKHFASLAGVRTAVLGIAFKPGTDDIRESPSLPVVRKLQARGALVKAFDPIARPAAELALGGPDIEFCDSLTECIDGVDAVILMTRWEQFEVLPQLLAGRTPQPVVIDGRRMIEPTRIARYEGVGL